MIAALLVMDNPMAPPLDSDYPRRGNAFSRSLASGFLRLAGWRVTNTMPAVPKAVIIGGPHTSNWDGIYTLAAMMQLGLDAHVMIKDSAFKGPFGAMLRWMGALPIARHKAGGVVEQTVEQFTRRDKLVMVVAPEGTRGGAAQWKTGFYRIAQKAGVPIVVATADYAKKEITFARVIEPCGDVEKDLAEIFECYAAIHPRHTDKLSAPLKAIRDRAKSARR
jgi:1-acyl-sn-glycerol-3-phosphate acyltransferase